MTEFLNNSDLFLKGKEIIDYDLYAKAFPGGDYQKYKPRITEVEPTGRSKAKYTFIKQRFDLNQIKQPRVSIPFSFKLNKDVILCDDPPYSFLRSTKEYNIEVAYRIKLKFSKSGQKVKLEKKIYIIPPLSYDSRFYSQTLSRNLKYTYCCIIPEIDDGQCRTTVDLKTNQIIPGTKFFFELNVDNSEAKIPNSPIKVYIRNFLQIQGPNGESRFNHILFEKTLKPVAKNTISTERYELDIPEDCFVKVDEFQNNYTQICSTTKSKLVLSNIFFDILVPFKIWIVNIDPIVVNFEVAVDLSS